MILDHASTKTLSRKILMKKIIICILLAVSSNLMYSQLGVVDKSYKQVLGATKGQLEAVKTQKMVVILACENHTKNYKPI